MRVKLDENLPTSLRPILQALKHAVVAEVGEEAEGLGHEVVANEDGGFVRRPSGAARHRRPVAAHRLVRGEGGGQGTHRGGE